MFWEEPRVPGLPGAEDVTDGSVDYYDTDWETVENGALEEECRNAMPLPAPPKQPVQKTNRNKPTYRRMK